MNRFRFGLQRWWLVAAGSGLALAVAFGLLSALVTSTQSLAPGVSARPAAGFDRSAAGTATPGATAASPTPTPATLAGPGLLGARPRLEAGVGGTVLGLGSLTELSRDAGKTWATLKVPGPITIGSAAGAPWLSGGAELLVSRNAGASWVRPATLPPAPQNYSPLLVSPYDPDVWFILHGGLLLRTRDGGVSWLDLKSLGQLSNPVIIAGGAKDRFYLASGSRVFELIDNGQQVARLPDLPSGVVAADLALISAGQPGTLMARDSSGAVYLNGGGVWSAAQDSLHGPISSIPGATALIGNGGSQLGAPGGIDFSLDSGATWAHATGLPSDQTVDALVPLPDGSALLAYCYGGDVYSSTDHGRTWTALSSQLRSTG